MVEQRAAPREEIVGERDPEERRHRPEAEGDERERALERPAARDGRDERGVEEAARQEPQQEAEAEGVAGDAAAECSRDAGEQPSAPTVGFAVEYRFVTLINSPN